jgi:hypothetical protein
MRKVLKDAKTLLFENMIKLNSDFKLKQLNERDDKWIQKAVNPEHKGFCTPMTKPTCTPQRKALAKRFKRGVENESVDIGPLFDPNEYQEKVQAIKGRIDNLINSGDSDNFAIIDSLYKMLVRKSKSTITPSPEKKPPRTMGTGTLRDVNLYEEKLAVIKESIDNISNVSKLNTINEIINKVLPKSKLNEIRQPNSPYYETLSQALDAVREQVGNKGFTVDEDDMQLHFGTGGISYGETKRANISLLKNGIPDKRRNVTIAIYRMDSGRYELTSYIN